MHAIFAYYYNCTDHVTFGIRFDVTRVRTWIERPRCRWNSTVIKRMRKQWKSGPFLLPFSGLGTRLSRYVIWVDWVRLHYFPLFCLVFLSSERGLHHLDFLRVSMGCCEKSGILIGFSVALKCFVGPNLNCICNLWSSNVYEWLTEDCL